MPATHAMNKTVLKDRILVLDTIYYQQIRESKEPISAESKFEIVIDSEEQIYERKLKATEEWKRLDCGWIKECCQLLLINEEGQFLQANPTEEERKDSEGRVIELGYNSHGHGYDGESWLIYPGCSMRACPKNLSSLWVRSQSGIARFSLCLYPK